MKNRIVAIVFITMMTSLTLIGCENSIVQKSIEKSKVLMENKEYEKALLSLENALDEDNNNEEANKLYKIINSYLEAKLAVEEGDNTRAEEVLNSIDSDYINYLIKDDVEKLKKEIENYYKEIEQMENLLVEADKLFNNKKYQDCKIYIEENILINEEFMTEIQYDKAIELLEKCENAIIENAIKKETETKNTVKTNSKQCEGCSYNKDTLVTINGKALCKICSFYEKSSHSPSDYDLYEPEGGLDSIYRCLDCGRTTNIPLGTIGICWDCQSGIE